MVTQVRMDQPHGGPRHVAAVARELVALGHPVRLLALGQVPPIEGVEVVPFDRAMGPGARAELALAAQVMREPRPDLAYVRISASTSAVPAAARLRGLPLMLELNGDILDELRDRGRPEPVVRAVQASLVLACRGAGAVVAASAKTGRHARDQLHAPNVVVIENGADLPVATPGDRAAARRALGLEADRRYLAFAATMGPELRIDLLFDALARLPGVGLVVAGDGPKAAEIRARALALAATNPVQMLGVVSHAQAVEVLRAADVCLNVRDGDLGMKCLEFAAIGRRFVTFELEGTDRYLPLYPGLDAVHLVRERSGAALAAAIGAALEAEAQRGSLADDAIARARGLLGWNRTAERIVEVAEGCLRR